jgi:hypothetical protein
MHKVKQRQKFSKSRGPDNFPSGSAKFADWSAKTITAQSNQAMPRIENNRLTLAPPNELAGKCSRLVKLRRKIRVTRPVLHGETFPKRKAEKKHSNFDGEAKRAKRIIEEEKNEKSFDKKSKTEALKFAFSPNRLNKAAEVGNTANLNQPNKVSPTDTNQQVIFDWDEGKRQSREISKHKEVTGSNFDCLKSDAYWRDQEIYWEMPLAKKGKTVATDFDEPTSTRCDQMDYLLFLPNLSNSMISVETLDRMEELYDLSFWSFHMHLRYGKWIAMRGASYDNKTRALSHIISIIMGNNELAKLRVDFIQRLLGDEISCIIIIPSPFSEIIAKKIRDFGRKSEWGKLRKVRILYPIKHFWYRAVSIEGDWAAISRVTTELYKFWDENAFRIWRAVLPISQEISKTTWRWLLTLGRHLFERISLPKVIMSIDDAFRVKMDILNLPSIQRYTPFAEYVIIFEGHADDILRSIHYLFWILWSWNNYEPDSSERSSDRSQTIVTPPPHSSKLIFDFNDIRMFLKHGKIDKFYILDREILDKIAQITGTTFRSKDSILQLEHLNQDEAKEIHLEFEGSLNCLKATHMMVFEYFVQAKNGSPVIALLTR